MKGIRTIALRLTGTKEAAEELEEMGEDTSDMIMSQSKMRELIMNATRVASNNYQGFDIQDELGRYKSTYEIMLGLSQIWDEIRQADLKSGDNRQNLLLESIAGKNRASIAASILQNPQTLMNVYEDSSTKAAGSAMEENQKKLDSISGHLARLTNAWQELWANAANRDIINMFIDLGTTILNVINEIGGLQSAFTLLYGGTILKGLMTADSWLVKFVQGLDNAKASSQGLGDTLNNVFTNLTGGGNSNKETRWKGLAQIQKNREDAKTGKTKNSIADETKEVIEANKELAESEELVQAATEGSTIAKEADMATEGAQTGAKMAGAMAEEADATSTANNTDQTNKNTIATEANTAAEGAQSVAKGAGGAAEVINSAGGIGGMIAGAVANPMTWLMAIPAVLALISTIINSIKKQQQELIDGEKEAASTWQEAKTGIDEYAQKYQELHTQLQNTNLSEQDQINIKQQIFDLQKQITDEYGHAADGVNLVNGNLDEQLEKLRQIKAEEAKKNLLDNEKEYKNARKAMEQERSYDMVVVRNAPVTQDAQDILKKYGYELKQRSAGMGTVEQYIEFKGDASDAEQALKDLYNEVGKFSEDERVSKGLNTFFDSISAATEQNNQVLRDHQEAYNAFLEAKIFDNDNLYGDAQKTAGEVLIQLEDAVNDYNIALQSGDTSQIEEAQKTFESLKGTVQDIIKDMGEVYSRPFDDIIDNVNQTAETAYNFQKKMDDPKVHSMAESVFGDLAENKKVSKQTQDEVLDAAQEILDIQHELAEQGLTDIISPLYEDINMKHTARFGNVDLANRPVLKWDDTTRQKYAKAWASWNTNAQGQVEPMPQNGDISTVFGSRGEFGKAQVPIAFTPMLNTGDKLEYLDKDTVYNYLDNIVTRATDESGNVDMNKIFTLDADPDFGKNLITAVGDTAKKYDKITHYLGKDGAYTTAMARLKKLAEQTNIPIEKMLASMRNLDNTSGIKQMFADTLPSVEDVKMALADTTGQFQDLQDFAQQNFNITAETPDAEIQGFIEAMQTAELVAVASTENSQKSLDDFYVDVSNKINTINELTSIASKGLGQGGLSFTKLLDENKKLVESDVSKIVDSFQHIYDLDVGSLFEETATGIKLNMDAYRQLIQEEESATKLQFASQRKKLESELKIAEAQGASKTEINKIKEQITDLDMLAAAYDGATSATAKYLAQQNAADYGDSYEMFRDTTVKRADELMGKGMIGTEEFRTIAQLFSYDSLATASADKVLEAYQTGYNNVKKYLTEDATIGMQTFLDDLVALPEEYGKFIKDADGNYMLEFTDAQEDKLAEHLNVSKDMLESFYDMLNALGFNVHFFRDGTLDEFDKLNENIHNSQDRLKELKETANDKDLIPDDLFEVNADELNTVEELQNYLTELSQLEIDPEVNPEEYEAWQTLLDQIKQKIDVLNSTGQNEDGSVSLGDFKQADEKVKYFKENFEDTIATLKEKSEDPVTIKAAIENDQEIKDFGTMLAQMPPEIQTYIAANLGINGFEPTNDPEQITQQLFGHLEQGIEIPAEVKVQDYYGEGHAPIGIDNIEAGVTVDPASEEAAKQEVADTIGAAEPDVGVRTHLASSAEELEPLASLGFNGEADFQINLGADNSQANEVIEETKEEATKETEMPLILKAENTAQEAADQAGVQQGVNTTTTETKVTNEETHTVATTDTAQLDVLNQKMQSVQAMGGSTVSIGVAVSGIENIEAAEGNINRLIAKDKSKVTVSINGNAAMFNRVYIQTNSALNALAQKKTEPKITANNSNLKDKVSEAKNKLNSIDDKKVHITASNSGFAEISNWKHNTYDGLHDKSIKVTTHYSYTGDPKMGKGGFQGSAHNQGTIVSKGHAYAGGTLSGNWGLPKAEKGALINELGSEIVVTPDGHWQILNGGDPTFTNLPKGAIIFNHKQTESLLKKGYVNGSHGKMVGGAFATGTVDDEDLDGNAYAVGTTKWNGALFGMSHAGRGGGNLNSANRAQNNSSNRNTSSNRSGSGNHHSGNHHSGNNNSSSNKKAKDNLQTLDAIEIRLNRIDALIAKLDTNAAKTYDTFANRNTALKNDLATVNKEIRAINTSLKSTDKTRNYLVKAADAAKEAGLKSGDEGYSSKSEGASGKALSQNWINKIKNFVDNGKYFTVTDVRNEGLWKKIQAYQTWYEKYVKLQQKVQDQTNKLSQLTIQQLTLIQTKWETSLNNIAADITKWQNTIDLANEKGYDAAEKYYNAEILLNKNRTKKLEAEAKELENKLKEAVKTGRIKEGSEEWYKWHIQIKNVKNEIIATNKEIQSLLNSIRQIRWDTFDRGQDELADMIDEAEFLGGLINEIDLFDKDTGFVTDKGKAAFGLEAQKYDLYIKQAQKYGEAVKELNAEIAKDPNNKTLIDQRNTWLKAQREAIENAHAEKEAIADLIEKGIKKQIEVMEELIDKYEKALDAEKDQQKYADSIAEKQKKINSLQKQLRSMEGDDSEEGATRRQKLRDELKEAQKDLEEAQEDQRISDIKDALSDMQERYEEFLNTKLEDIDALLQEVVSGVNQSGADICSTIQDVAHSVNYTISSNLQATYTAVQNLGANVASIANQIGALVSGTSDTTGTITNTSATTVKNTPTPVVPAKVTMPTEPKKTTGSTGTSKAKNGIVKENGKTYYYKNGKKQTGWQTINGKKYYFSTKDSNMLTGVQKIGNKYYLLDKSTGVLKDKYSGLYKQNSGTYYFKNGDMQTGWQSMNAGKRYFSTKNGKMLTGVQTIGKDNYYFNEDGVLQIGKFNVGDYTYETDKDGKIKKKTRRTGGVTSIKGNTILSTMSYIEGKGTGGITGFASGTKKVPKDDIYRVDEMGKEAFINKQGKIYTRLEKGTTVLPHDAAVNLLKGMSNPAEFIASHMDMRPNKTITTTNNNTGNTVNNITFNLPNVSDYKEFMREAQRDPNFTKYIQEISIGKLNGNNSLRGNAIQFR